MGTRHAVLYTGFDLSERVQAKQVPDRSMSRKTALISGISGQDGAYLAHLLLSKGYRVHGTSRDAEAPHFANLIPLGIKTQIQLHSASLSDFRSTVSILTMVEPDEIYNLAGQSSVVLSFDQPVETFESVTVGTMNILECVRFPCACSTRYRASDLVIPASLRTKRLRFVLAAPTQWLPA